jgi:hypothetical protein
MKKKPKFKVGQVVFYIHADGLGYVRIVDDSGRNIDGDVEYTIAKDTHDRNTHKDDTHETVVGEWTLRALTAREVGPDWTRKKGR